MLVVGKLIGTILHSTFADFYLIVATPAEVCPLDNLQGMKVVSVFLRKQTKSDSLDLATHKGRLEH